MPTDTFPSLRPPRPPFALDTPTFSFAALAALAGRAPLGGVREVAIAAWAAARMADEARPGGLTDDEKQARAAAAKKWMSTLSMTEPVRRAMADLIEASEKDGPAAAAALRRVIEVTGPMLDQPSRSELDRLARDLDAQMVART